MRSSEKPDSDAMKLIWTSALILVIGAALLVAWAYFVEGKN